MFLVEHVGCVHFERDGSIRNHGRQFVPHVRVEDQGGIDVADVDTRVHREPAAATEAKPEPDPGILHFGGRAEREFVARGIERDVRDTAQILEQVLVDVGIAARKRPHVIRVVGDADVHAVKVDVAEVAVGQHNRIGIGGLQGRHGAEGDECSAVVIRACHKETREFVYGGVVAVAALSRRIQKRKRPGQCGRRRVLKGLRDSGGQ